MTRFYRFAWSRFCGYPLQIPKDSVVEALRFGKLRAVLIRWNGHLYITDRYALRRMDV